MSRNKFNRTVVSAIVGFFIMLWSTVGLAQTVPNVITFQSVLFDDSGNVISDETADILFRILDDQNNEIYSEEQSGVQVYDGMINVMLGSGVVPGSNPATPTGGLALADLDPATVLFLEVTVQGVTTLEPMELTSVPYSFYAQQAQSVALGAVTSTMIAQGAITAAHLENISITDLLGILDVAQLPAGATLDSELSAEVLTLNTTITAHTSDTANPHGVTAVQAGAAPVAHVTDTANPHAVTAAQSGASPAGHNHDASYVNVGGDAMSGSLNMGGNNVTNVGSVDGYDVSATLGDHETRVTALEGGPDFTDISGQIAVSQVPQYMRPAAFGSLANIGAGDNLSNTYNLASASQIAGCAGGLLVQVNFSSSLSSGNYVVMLTDGYPVSKAAGNFRICAYSSQAEIVVFHP